MDNRQIVLVSRSVGVPQPSLASVPQHEKAQIRDLMRLFHELACALIEVSKPTFALVREQCLGGGLELASFCHWIFGSKEAQFGQPEVKLAACPLAACLILPHRIGQVAADDIVLTGRSLSADEALRIGLIQSVCRDPALNSTSSSCGTFCPRASWL